MVEEKKILFVVLLKIKQIISRIVFWCHIHLQFTIHF